MLLKIILRTKINRFKLKKGIKTNSRGLGLWAAFDLPSMTERDDLWEEMMKNKLLILTSGDKSIRFRPHLTTNKEEIDAAMSIIDVSIKKCLR